VRALVARVVSQHEARLRIWPAAQLVHHAYRGGFLEHILQIARVGIMLAETYGADRDIVIAGALLHDIGKLQELSYETTTSYSREGNLLGHIAIGLVMVREAAQAIPDFPETLRTQIEHLVLSHHGSYEFGSPVEPMTVEAFILSAADELDAKINQVRQAISDDTGEGEFTGYQHRLGRILYKGGA
jgi:3'-5' exoribonuclease